MTNDNTNTNKSPIDTSTIGGRIKYLRTKRGMSQETFANRLATTKSVVCRWEKGVRIPNEDMVREIADLCRVSPDYIRFGKDGRYSEDYLYVGGLTYAQIRAIKQLVEAFSSNF